MRSKEEAHDYRYFPDPDLLPLDITSELQEKVRATLPESQQAKQTRYVKLGISAEDTNILTASREMAEFFDATLASLLKKGVGTQITPETPSAEIYAARLSNWLIGEVSAQLNREGLDMTQCPITPQQLGGMLKLIVDGIISNSAAKEVFRTMWIEGGDADAIIEAKGLKQVSDSGAIEKIVDEIIAANPAQVAEYRSGKDKVFGFFVGQAMKASKGKANPAQLNEVLKKKLAG
jgi:aspartyl-tRNA(Asn)/glutamyl-tRNA(Gln) amidotransferase subunit B